MKTKFVTLSLFLVAASICWGQDRPLVSPRLMDALQLAATGFDAYGTDRNIRPGYVEHNPIARPFDKTRTDMIVYMSVEAGLKIGIAHWLEHRRHYRLALAARAFGIADNLHGGATSVANFR